MNDSATSNLRLAEARDIVASGTSGKSLPVIEFMDAQQAEIERLTAALAACQTYDYRQIIEESDRLRAALEKAAADLRMCSTYVYHPDSCASMEKALGKVSDGAARVIIDLEHALRGESETAP